MAKNDSFDLDLTDLLGREETPSQTNAKGQRNADPSRAESWQVVKRVKKPVALVLIITHHKCSCCGVVEKHCNDRVMLKHEVGGGFTYSPTIGHDHVNLPREFYDIERDIECCAVCFMDGVNEVKARDSELVDWRLQDNGEVSRVCI